MTPEEKGKELLFKFYKIKKRPLISFWKDISHAKACALICVAEILDEFPQGYKGNFEEKRKYFWQQVKDYLIKQ